jgi:GcrA cell cycle regulator
VTTANDLTIAWFRDGLTYTQIAHRLASEHGIRKTRNAVAGYLTRAREKGVPLPDKRSAIACENTRKRAERQAERQEENTRKRAERQAAKQARMESERRPPIQAVEFTATPEPETLYTGFTGSLAILGLHATACCWPIGDPKEESFRYCCEPTTGRYCERHAALGRQSRAERHENTVRYKALIHKRKRSRYA